MAALSRKYSSYNFHIFLILAYLIGSLHQTLRTFLLNLALLVTKFAVCCKVNTVAQYSNESVVRIVKHTYVRNFLIVSINFFPVQDPPSRFLWLNNMRSELIMKDHDETSWEIVSPLSIGNPSYWTDPSWIYCINVPYTCKQPESLLTLLADSNDTRHGRHYSKYRRIWPMGSKSL